MESGIPASAASCGESTVVVPTIVEDCVVGLEIEEKRGGGGGGTGGGGVLTGGTKIGVVVPIGLILTRGVELVTKDGVTIVFVASEGFKLLSK